MIGWEHIPAPYYEEKQRDLERAAAEKAKATASTSATKGTTPDQQSVKSQEVSPAQLHALLDRHSRMQHAKEPTGYIGSVARGFSKNNSGVVTPAFSRQATPAREKTQMELQAQMAQQKRDADIVGSSDNKKTEKPGNTGSSWFWKKD